MQQRGKTPKDEGDVVGRTTKSGLAAGEEEGKITKTGEGRGFLGMVETTVDRLDRNDTETAPFGPRNDWSSQTRQKSAWDLERR